VKANAASPRRIKYLGAIADLTPEERRALFDRASSTDDTVRMTVDAILDVVQRDGDAALISLARELDKARLTTLEVPRDRWRTALDAIEPDVRTAMERAAANITSVHRAFLPQPTETYTEPGILVGRRPDPLRRVGVYAPGGRSPYPSSVLMGVIPARVAGVGEIIVCSPPDASGSPAGAVLAAAELAGADRLFAVGGPGAIAAMAHGTQSVPRVDRIVGPGNIYVAEAKLRVSHLVAIDSPAGPSELIVICDSTADIEAVAREVLAQAEHDPHASVIVVAVGEGIAETVIAAIGRALPPLERKQIIADALASRGGVLAADSLDEAIAFVNEFAPEHLLLAIDLPEITLEQVRNVGTVFLGETSSVAFGDYMTGANHVLPTGGLARSYSGLSTLDFVRWTTYQKVDRDAAARLAPDVAAFATAEHLPGHASAARGWG
jgi:histidinol dehydrogenase